jgi:hypothetical protein
MNQATLKPEIQIQARLTNGSGHRRKDLPRRVLWLPTTDALAFSTYSSPFTFAALEFNCDCSAASK